MLFIISRILFIWYTIWIIWVFFSFLLFWNNLQIDKNLLSILFLPIIIPIFDKIFEYIKKDSVLNFDFSKENIFKLVLSFFLIIIIFFAREIFFIDLWIVFLIFLWIFFAIDERFYFLISLIILIFVPLELILENKELAEKLSIYVYYFLCIWVIISIINQTINKNLSEKQNTLFFKKIKKEKLAENIVYISFIAFLTILSIILISWKIFLIKFLVIWLIFIYLIWKIFWFEINYKIENKEKEWLKLSNWYILSFILTIVIIKYITKI